MSKQVYCRFMTCKTCKVHITGFKAPSVVVKAKTSFLAIQAYFSPLCSAAYIDTVATH